MLRDSPVRAFTVGSRRIVVAMFVPPEGAWEHGLLLLCHSIRIAPESRGQRFSGNAVGAVDLTA